MSRRGPARVSSHQLIFFVRGASRSNGRAQAYISVVPAEIHAAHSAIRNHTKIRNPHSAMGVTNCTRHGPSQTYPLSLIIYLSSPPPFDVSVGINCRQQAPPIGGGNFPTPA